MSKYGAMLLLSILKPLLKLQNKILLIITLTYHPIDKDRLYYSTGILPLKIVMHKLTNGNVPKHLQKCVSI